MYTPKNKNTWYICYGIMMPDKIQPEVSSEGGVMGGIYTI
jgi:hypothetical protein